jgi:hypothetical protein
MVTKGEDMWRRLWQRRVEVEKATKLAEAKKKKDEEEEQEVHKSLEELFNWKRRRTNEDDNVARCCRCQQLHTNIHAASNCACKTASKRTLRAMGAARKDKDKDKDKEHDNAAEWNDFWGTEIQNMDENDNWEDKDKDKDKEHDNAAEWNEIQYMDEDDNWGP